MPTYTNNRGRANHSHALRYFGRQAGASSTRQQEAATFSHIQILSRPASEYNEPGDDNSSEAFISRPSLSREVEAGMSTIRPTQDTLANMPSGMSFAQKARAAELHAARSRKAAQEAEDHVPDLGPVSLGAFKFTKRLTTRAKSQKADGSDDKEQNPQPFPDNPPQVSLPPTTAVRPSSTSTIRSAYERHLQEQAAAAAQLRATYEYDESTPQLPALRQQPKLEHPSVSCHLSSIVRDDTPESEAAIRFWWLFSKWTCLWLDRKWWRVHAETDQWLSQPVQIDDPFVNQTFVPNFDGYSGQQSTLPQRASVRMPPAVKGTLDQQYRFPQAHEVGGIKSAEPSPHVRRPSLAGQVSKRPEDYAEMRAMNDPKAVTKILTRDPHPYTGFTAPSTKPSMSKAEMLMQNLERLTSEKSGPNTGRTVLYDPVAQHSSRNASDQDLSKTLHPTTNRIPQPLDLTNAGGPGLYTTGNDSLNTSSTIGPATARYAPLPYSPQYIAEQEEKEPEPEDDAIPMSANEYMAALAHPRSPTQEEKDAELIAWFTNKPADHAYVHDVLERQAQRLGILVAGASTPPQQRTVLAPIGSGRKTSSSSLSRHPTASSTPTFTNTNTPGYNAAGQAKQAANQQKATHDLMAGALSSLRIHASNDRGASGAGAGEGGDRQGNPFTRYKQPPAWCIDDKSEKGRRSFLGDVEWNPPRRVGRDPRYPVVYHEGRATYFEDVGGVGGGGGGSGGRGWAR
ncbi:uncharacterized protein KY384_001238 [Bacidia gigantensis]|uniref:uncharacterized protein n=1 Tax=Bacidia gigantensis TaxID=2732470 RepID=UPI001D0467F7|nr:uncharacterized protein KY384_001238 [Bacidia gigantensis]KAG8534393.1 hypothetical protein KY384_001238 [Bacidia gigantensis]